MKRLPTIKVLYEDDNYLAVNKPDGLIVHSDGRTVEPSLVDWILKNRPEIRGVGESAGGNIESRIQNLETENKKSGLEVSNPDSIITARTEQTLVRSGGQIPDSTQERPGIVHRIDRDTSGVVVIAKNQIAFGCLKKRFQKKEVRKIYHTFVYGEIKQDHGWIDRPIGRSKNDFRRWTAERGTRGEMREAITYYFVLKRGKGLTFLEIQPKTGRTHQIRVHLKAIGHPVVCDKLYAPQKETALGFERLALHAKSIEFIDQGGKKIFVEAPYPKDFKSAIKKFGL